MRGVKFLVLLVLVTNIYATIVFPKPLYRAYLNLIQGKPHIGETFTLRLSIKALADAPQTKIEWHFGSEHINLLSANLIDTVSLNAGDSANYDYDLQIDKIGSYAVAAEISSLDTTQKDLWHAAAKYYIAVYQDTVFYADTSLGNLPYNIEIPDSLIEGMMDSLKKWGGTIPRWTATVRMYGTVRYRDNDINSNVPVPRIKMVLMKGFVWVGELVSEWYTDENGNYDVTLNLTAPNIYTLFVQSETPDVKAFGFPSLPPVWIFDPVDQFWVFFDHTRNFNPTITSGNEIVEMLLNVRKVKEWTLGNFGITLNFVTIVYPAPGYIPAPSYCPMVYWAPYTWAELGFGDDIYIGGNQNLWGIGGMKTIAHEWGHAFYYGTLFNHVVPSGVTDFEEHWFTMVSNPGFAWNEGFAEFFEYASVMDDFPYNTSLSKTAEDFYRGGDTIIFSWPYYMGSAHNNSDGRKVEGAVMQFLYDLWDSKTTPDNYPNWHPYNTDPNSFDDENVNQPVKMRQTWQAMAQDVVNNYGWAYYNYWMGFLGAWYKSTTWELGIQDFKDYWDGLNFPNISEIYNVVIHPFNYVPQYDLPIPYNLQATIVDQSIKLTWSENTLNEGGFWIRRKIDNNAWQNYYALIKNPNQTQWYDSNVSEHTYKYKLSAITADTSESSPEITIQGPLNAPSGLSVVGQPTPNSVTIRWTDNSGIEVGFKIGRMVDDEGWNPTNENYATIGPSQGVGGTVQFTDNVEFLHKYTYKVRAYDNAGHYSAWSNVVEYTSGVLAQSSYPWLSAYNSNCKIVRSLDGKFHITYSSGGNLYYTFTPDGYTFREWKTLSANNNALSLPAIAINNRTAEPIIGFWRKLGIRLYMSFTDTTSTGGGTFWYYDAPTYTYSNPSFVWACDTAWIVYRGYRGKESNLYVSAYPRLLGGNYQIISTSGGVGNPSIGYDKGGRLVVISHSAANGGIRLFFKNIGSSNWNVINIPNAIAYGEPSLWVGQNELRIAFEGEAGNNWGLIFMRLLWSGNSYTVQSIELVSENIDYDWTNGIEGYTYLAGPDVVLWKYNDDIWYAQRQGGEWITLGNLSQSGSASSYPQGIVFGSFLRQKLFALWTEESGNNYYLVRKIINLPSPYPNVRTVARIDNPEATGFNNAQRLLRDTQGRLHLAFTSNNQIYHTFLQDTSWSEPVLIGEGKYPALALGPDGRIYCLWSYNQGQPDFLEELRL